MTSKHISDAILVCLAAAFAPTLVAKTPSPLTNFSRPLSFEANQGQADNQVEFVTHGLNYNLFLSQGNAAMVLGGAVVRMMPVGANRAIRGELADPLPGISNYLIGNDPAKWRTRIPTYAKVRYAAVYPGIDLIYYGNQRQLEYDFLVQPFADSRTIALNFESKTAAKLNADGELVLHASAGDLIWHKPVAYQEIGGRRQGVKCAYVRRGKHLAFDVGAYDRTKSLVIDPVLVYSTFLGGSGTDTATGIAVDTKGNAYVTGSTNSTDFPIKHALQTNPRNIFVTKFDSAGTALLYSTYFGGSGNDYANGIAVDKFGEAYIAGATTSTNFPVKNAFQAKNNSKYAQENAFVAKLSVNGADLVFSTYFGGSGTDSCCFGDGANAIALDNDGNPYVSGATASIDFPLKNAFQTENNSYPDNSNAFAAKFCAGTGALLYSTYLGGSNGDSGTAIAVDSKGSAYITGTTGSRDFPLKNPFQGTLNGFKITYAFVTKLAPAGNALVYSTYLGGTYICNTRICDGTVGSGIAVDADGEAYVTGTTYSSDFPTTKAFEGALKSQVGDGFITKFDAAGTGLVFSSYLGGSGFYEYGCGTGLYVSGGDGSNAIALDGSGNAYLTGFTASSDFPILDAFETKYLDYPCGGPATMAFATKVRPDGTLVYSSYLGGSNYDEGFSIAVDLDGNAYITGLTGSPDFPTEKPFQSTLKGNRDAFVSKVSAQ